MKINVLNRHMAKPIEIRAIALKNVFGKYLDRERIFYRIFTMLSSSLFKIAFNYLCHKRNKVNGKIICTKLRHIFVINS